MNQKNQLLLGSVYASMIFAIFMKSTGKQTYTTVDGDTSAMSFSTKISKATLNLSQNGTMSCSALQSPLVWQIPHCPCFITCLGVSYLIFHSLESSRASTTKEK